MTENTSEQDKKLSFKEKILRDLEEARGSQPTHKSLEELLPHHDVEPEVVAEPGGSLLEELVTKTEPAPLSADSFSEHQLEEFQIRSSEPLSEGVSVAEELSSAERLASLRRKIEVSYQTQSQEAEYGTHTIRQPARLAEPEKKPTVESPAESSAPVEETVKTQPSKLPTEASKFSEPQKKEASIQALGQEEPLSRASRQEVKSYKTKKKNKVVGRVVLTLTLLLLLAVGITGFFGYRYVTAALGPVDAKDTKFVTVEIPEGSGTKYIASLLKDAGVIKDAHVFNYYAKFKNYGNFQSGYYNLQKSMDLDTIAQKLQEGGTEIPQAPVVGKIVIPEGYTIDQIAQAVTVNADSKKKDKTPFTAEAFLKAIQDDTFIEQEIAKYPKLLASLPAKDSGVKYRLEGYLFPATYNYGESTTAEELIDQMLAAMDKNLANYYDVLASKNLTVNEMLTMASLVEKEGSTDADRKDIASVFYNRLNQGMQLQSNIAILYAQGKLGQKTTLAEDAGIDTNIDSPYNIYKNTGLMPGAVDNPGLSAIEAAVNPNKTDYLYFVANVETGQVYFAQTFEEHNKNVEEHVNSKLTQASQ